MKLGRGQIGKTVYSLEFSPVNEFHMTIMEAFHPPMTKGMKVGHKNPFLQWPLIYTGLVCQLASEHNFSSEIKHFSFTAPGFHAVVYFQNRKTVPFYKEITCLFLPSFFNDAYRSILNKIEFKTRREKKVRATSLF